MHAFQETLQDVLRTLASILAIEALHKGLALLIGKA
jgi:hypothetical protein